TTGTTAPRPAETRASDQTTPSASAVTTPTTADNEPAPQTAERVVTVPATAPPTRTTVPDPSSSVDEENQAVIFERANNDPITTGKFGPGIYKIELREPDAGNYGVQVASLTSLESALQEVAKFQAKWFENILVRRVETEDNTVYKITLGPFETLENAQTYAKDLLRKYKIKGFATKIRE
ncbi:MAG: SPOR domain-containing protein, partial [Bacteroidota bacterium]